jgi:dienelactone hydrolase
MNPTMYERAFFLLATLCIFASACATMTVTPELVQQHLSVEIPEGPGKFPVVIYYQGTGADNLRAERWARWFKTLGVASAIVDNAKMRNRKTNPGGSMYTEDAAFAWDLLKANPRIDTDRFALMGFSRGGQQALEAGPHFTGERPAPTFVFALYPGGWTTRNTCRSSHPKPTQVHIFYGDRDDVTTYDGFAIACKSLAKSRDNVEYHELEGATHAYDTAFRPHTFQCCGNRTVDVVPNPDAVARTQAIIEKAVRAKWGA